ncbi:MAG TPA: hypothetical protein DEO85_07975 [Maritimibacter sp.]|nr:hypothetical protein [Maritimibacter sp.]
MNWSRFSGQLSGSARTGAWLAEVGRWQDDAMQVTAFSDGKITAYAMRATPDLDARLEVHSAGDGHHDGSFGSDR